MTLIAVPVPNLVQGVSQQAESLRFTSQAELQDDAYPSITDGLMKRHPIDHVKKLVSTQFPDNPLVHFINRDASERYVVLVSHQSVQVFDLAGTSIPVKGPTTPYNADFSYLNLFIANLLSNPERLDTGSWVANADAYTITAPGIAAPASSFQAMGLVQEVGSKSGAVGNGTYTQAIGTFAAVQTFSIFIRKGTLAGNEVPQLRLSIRDTSNSLDHTAVFNRSGDNWTVASAENGAVAKIENYAALWYRASVSFTVGTFGGGATVVGSGRSVKVEASGFHASQPRTLLVFAAQLVEATVAADYGGRPSQYLKAITIADYTIVLNTLKTVAIAGATTGADPSNNKAFLLVRAGNYKTNYKVSLKHSGSGTTYSATVSTWDGTGPPDAVREQWSLSILTPGAASVVWSVTILGFLAQHTNDAAPTATEVATGLRTAINALPNVSAGGTGTNVTILGDFAGQSIDPVVSNTGTGTWTLTETTPASSVEETTIKTDILAQKLTDAINAIAGAGFTADRSGSVVRIAHASTIEKVEVSDSQADTSLIRIWRAVPDIDDLPLVCEDGFKVRVDGDTETGTDDYYVKFTADTAAAFGPGTWSESNGFGITHQLDDTTMPWRLIRKQDDGSGTVTGTPNAKYFEWSKAVWSFRDVGDASIGSNPDPSFVGKTIANVFFFANRLGLTAGQNVVMSEVGRYFNFFRTTVLQLLDSDPIDVAVPHVSVVTLNHAIPFHERLVLFTDFTSFVLSGEPVLTPKTVQVKPAFEHESLRHMTPVATDRGVFFGSKNGDFSTIQEFLPSNSVPDSYESDHTTAAVPKYISGVATRFAVSQTGDLLLVAADGNRAAVYIYKYYYSGNQKLQSAWFRYTTGTEARVYGFEFIDATLYLIVQREDGMHLESSIIAEGRADVDATYLTHLDRRVPAGPGAALTGTFAAGNTSWTMPYSPNPSDTTQVVERTTATYAGGKTYAATVSGTVVTVAGVDLTAVPVWIGVRYLKRYKFTRPNLKQPPTSTGGRGLIASGRYQLLHGTLVFDRSVFFQVVVTPKGRTSKVVTYGSTSVAAVPAAGKKRFPVYCRADDASIEIQNNSPLPSNIQSAEWEAEYSTRSALFRG